eukprot:3455408-Rhodomonas_salina.6
MAGLPAEPSDPLTPFVSLHWYTRYLCLCACCVMSGALCARDPVRTCACDAMSGTDRSYAAIGLRACYAMPGTDVAPWYYLYSHTLTACPTRVLCEVRY